MIDPDILDDAYLLSRAGADLLNEEDGATFDAQKNPLAVSPMLQQTRNRSDTIESCFESIIPLMSKASN